MTALQKAKEGYEDAVRLGVDIVISTQAMGALLKEANKEPVRVKKIFRSDRVYHACGQCETTVKPSDLYCRHCGRPLLWVTVQNNR